MPTLDLSAAARVFWGSTELQKVYGGGTLAWTKPVTNTIGFLHSNSVAGSSITFDSSVAEGNIVFALAVTRANDNIPSLPSGWTSLDTIDESFCQARLMYRIAPSGGMTGTGTSTNAGFMIYAAYSKTGGTWDIGTHVEGNNLSTNCIYAAVTPRTNDWVCSLNANAGSFDWATLSAGTNPTSREQANLGSTCRVRVYDSNGVATSWPGQTTDVGYTRWMSYAIPFRLG